MTAALRLTWTGFVGKVQQTHYGKMDGLVEVPNFVLRRPNLLCALLVGPRKARSRRSLACKMTVGLWNVDRHPAGLRNATLVPSGKTGRITT